MASPTSAFRAADREVKVAGEEPDGVVVGLLIPVLDVAEPRFDGLMPLGFLLPAAAERAPATASMRNGVAVRCPLSAIAGWRRTALYSPPNTASQKSGV